MAERVLLTGISGYIGWHSTKLGSPLRFTSSWVGSSIQATSSRVLTGQSDLRFTVGLLKVNAELQTPPITPFRCSPSPCMTSSGNSSCPGFPSPDPLYSAGSHTVTDRTPTRERS